jgi:methyl-accepting chemotaxis protein
MTALLNQLLEEATLRTTELAAHSEGCATAAAEVIEHAQAMGNRAADEAKSLHAEYQEAIAAIKHAMEQARQAADETSKAVAEVPQEAAKAGHGLGELISGLHEEITQMGELRARLMNGLADSTKQADAEFRELAQQVQEFSTHLQARVEEARVQADRIYRALEAAGTAIEKVRTSSKEIIVDLGKQATESAGEMAHGLDQLLAAVSHGIVMFCNNTITNHNELTAAMREGYLDETKNAPCPAERWTKPALQPIRDAIAEFAQLAPTAQSVLTEAVANILDEGEKAITSLVTVAQSLQQALPQVAA